MAISKPAAPVQDQQEQQPLGPVALWFLWLLSQVVLVGSVFALLVLAALMDTNTALTIVLLLGGLHLLAFRRQIALEGAV